MVKALTDEQFVLLLPKHVGRLRAFLSTMIPNCHDIDEVVQDACLVAWRKFEGFRYSGETPDEEFVRWVCSIAKFEAIRYRRENCRHGMAFDEAVIESLAAVQLRYTNDFLRRETILQHCISKLPDRDRRLVSLRYRVGGTSKEAARELGRTVSAVHKALTKIRKLLSECVEREMRSEGAV
jgi:RNA polymerase sigma-70 factor (ECF subfamily)